MAGRKNKKKPEEAAIFDSIRKPTAPPTKTFGKAKPEERIHPSVRKVKHKRKLETED